MTERERPNETPKLDIIPDAASLLWDVLGAHSTPDSCDYQECDVDPCQWCVDARRIIGVWLG